MDNTPQHEASPKVSVIIPTYNRRDLAVSCLESLRGQHFRDFEIIVVDDASQDDTVEVLHRDFPDVELVVRDTNGRFAKAVNAGIRKARGEWFFLLNNDVSLAPDVLELLVEAGESRGAGMVAPLILWQDEPDVVYAAGDRIRADGRPESIGFRVPLADFTLPGRIFGVTAAAGLYSRALLDTVGPLDEAFVAYFEDSDLCLRARLAGFEAVLVPEAKAYHIGSASIQGQTWWRSAQCYRNHALLVGKNFPLPILLRHAPTLLRERFHQARSLFTSARTQFGALGALRVLLSIWLSLLGCLPRVLRERRRLRVLRKLSAADFAAWLYRA